MSYENIWGRLPWQGWQYRQCLPSPKLPDRLHVLFGLSVLLSCTAGATLRPKEGENQCAAFSLAVGSNGSYQHLGYSLGSDNSDDYNSDYSEDDGSGTSVNTTKSECCNA